MVAVTRLVWDEWNVAHSARHDVTPEEVEACCHGGSVQLQGKKGRIILLGTTRSGRCLAVILDPEKDKGVYYPVAARPASRSERRYFEEQKGGGDE